jgi:hypothetical protein
MSRLDKVIVGNSPQSLAACSGKSGALPYSAMPSRTQSPASVLTPSPRSGDDAWRRMAALLHSERSPGRSRVAASNAATWCAMPRAPSASLKWVMSDISSTCGSALSRAHAARNAVGVKPRRFMPLLSLRNTRCGTCVLWAASQSICSLQCTVCHRCRREHSSRSRGSNTPSSSSTGPRQSSARTRSASARSISAKPSVLRRPSKQRSMPCPYAFALTTVQTRASGARERACSRLWRKASVWTVARMGRGMARSGRTEKPHFRTLPQPTRPSASAPTLSYYMPSQMACYNRLPL